MVNGKYQTSQSALPDGERSMSIIVNGRRTEFKQGETLTDLLRRMKYVFPLVVVRIDGEVIAKSGYDKTLVTDESEIEVLHLTSGG
jgi:thiamine biosynthesis protein ThiS